MRKIVEAALVSFLILPLFAIGNERVMGRRFQCADVVGISPTTQVNIYHGHFTTRLRGKDVRVSYIKNRRKLSAQKDVVLVLPGLNKPAFQEKVLGIGSYGEQAISLDLTNINGVGPIQAPTPEEDAKIVRDLLLHLGLNKAKFQKQIYIVNHSRGALISSRLVSAHYKRFNFGGLIQFNPYVGWIPQFHASAQGESYSSGIRFIQLFLLAMPLSHLATEVAATLVEETTAMMSRSMIERVVNIHNRESAHRVLSVALDSEDEIFVENIRQKLIGMENAEVYDDYRVIRELGIPMVIISGDQDQVVPSKQIEQIVGEFDVDHLMYWKADHYLPYLKNDETTKILHQILTNYRAKAPSLQGIRLN